MKPKFYRKVLNNGITILFEERNIPVISLGFAIRQGGIYERLDEKGISHFIEHMLYKGTKTRKNKEIAEEIEGKGGDLNGFTSDLITAYWCKLPSKYLKTGLEVFTDLIKNPLFDEKEFEKERKVIFEEIKLHKDNPLYYVFDEIQKSLYDGIMSINLIGNYETMNSITREKLFEKFNEVYHPENLILCVVGKANFKEIIDFVENNFKKSYGKKPLVQEFRLKNESRVVKRKGIDQTNLVFAYHVPLAGDKKSYAAKVLSCLIAEGMSSRLFSEIREKRNLAYSVKGGVEITRYFAYNFIYVGTSQEYLDKVKNLILKEFKDVGNNLDENELQNIKERMIGSYKISMEDSQNQMINLLDYEVNGNAEDFYDFEKRIKEVKLEDVRELARKASEKFSFFALVPE